MVKYYKGTLEKQNLPEGLSYASPLDRLASFVFDLFVIVLPIFSIVSIQLRNSWFESYILKQGYTSFYYLILLFALFALVLIIYQSVMIKLYKQTIGQRLFQIMIIPFIKNEELSWRDCFVRGMSLTLNIPLAGWLGYSIFRDSRRRTYYDKVSDTLVVYTPWSTKKTSQPNESEISFSRGIQVGVICYILILLYPTLKMIKESKTEKQAENTCDSSLNLDEALALYFANDFEKDCLLEITQLSIEDKKNLAESYLSMSIINSNTNPEISNRYLKQVCIEGESPMCYLSRFIANWDSSDSINQIMLNVSEILEQKSLISQVWAIRALVKVGEWDKLVQVLNKLQGLPMFSYFTKINKAKYYWAKGETEFSNDLYESLYVGIASEDKQYEISKEYCYHKSLEGCEAVKQKSLCQSFFEKSKVYSTTPQKQVILLTDSICKERPIADYKEHFSDDFTVYHHTVKLQELMLAPTENLKEILSLIEDEPLVEWYYSYLKNHNLSKNQVTTWYNHWVMLDPFLRKKTSRYIIDKLDTVDPLPNRLSEAKEKENRLPASKEKTGSQ